MLEVKQVSRGSFFKSFCVTVEKYEDYKKLMSGAHVPEHLRVRRFFPPKSDSDDSASQSYRRPWESSSSRVTAYNEGVAQLNQLDIPLRRDTPTSMETESSTLPAQSATGAASTQEQSIDAASPQEQPRNNSTRESKD